MSNRHLAGMMAVGAILVTAGCDGSSSADAETGADAARADGKPHRVILDYSPTLSDVSALMYLSQHPEVELLAVTLVGTGESHCDPGVANTIGLLELAGLPDVPVACGQTDAIGSGNEWPAEWRQRSDALVGLVLPSGRPGDGIDAADLLAEVASAQNGPVTIVAVGPLTNVAAALQRHEDFDDDVARIVTMGGAFDVSGNAPNRSAEWNYYIDPTAVEIVFGSGIPVTVVPLDATNDVPVTRQWFDELALHRTTAAAGAVHDLLSATPGWELGFSFWDELAAAVVVDPTLAIFEQRRVVVVTEGSQVGSTHTAADGDGVSVHVAMSADAERFEHELLTGLNGGAEAPEPTAATGEEVAYFTAVARSRATVEDGIGELFGSPEASAIDEFMSEDPATLTPEQEQLLRIFFETFWAGAVDLIEVHADEVAGLVVPPELSPLHDAYHAALVALVENEGVRLTDLADLHGEELMAFVWGTDVDIERVETTCDELQLQVLARGLDTELCPD